MNNFLPTIFWQCNGEFHAKMSIFYENAYTDLCTTKLDQDCYNKDGAVSQGDSKQHHYMYTILFERVSTLLNTQEFFLIGVFFKNVYLFK